MTGEPYAGEPPVRFGGRGGKTSLPLSITQNVLAIDLERYFVLNTIFHRLTPVATCCRRLRGSTFIHHIPQADACGYMLRPLSRLQTRVFRQENLHIALSNYVKKQGPLFINAA